MAAAAAGEGSKGTILVVDDNRLVLATLSDGLTRAGYHVYDADNGDDAILIARAHRPSSRCSTSGWKARAASTSPTTCATSAACRSCSSPPSPTSETVARSKALGAVAYLVKPLDIEQIVPAVEAAFAHLESRHRCVRRQSSAPAFGANARDTSAAMAVAC